jgi:hypothetical protein
MLSKSAAALMGPLAPLGLSGYKIEKQYFIGVFRCLIHEYVYD